MKQRTHSRLSKAIVICGFLAPKAIFAQVVPDATLPNNSSVTTDGNTSTITGGTQAGSNLFHSFDSFSVTTDATAYFNNPPDIQNIISRVTGASASNIDGLIRVNGSANLFLLNPNGIIFGSNARLNIGGSFLASTASSLKFVDETEFSATKPQSPPLLTVSVPFGLQFGSTPGDIVVQSRPNTPRTEASIDNFAPSILKTPTLKVQPGRTLAFVGGNVKLDGGKLQAPGGRVELGGVAGTGIVGLSVNGSNLGLSFLDGVARANVSLDNAAEVNVRAGGGGSIAINSRDLNISGANTRVRAGINSGSGSIDSQAGDIDINATEAINIDESVVSNAVLVGGMGNGGNINITTSSLRVTNGAQLAAITDGKGNTGSVNINARDTVSFDGVNSNGIPSTVSSIVADTGVGNGGDINITTGSFSLTDGAQLAAVTYGQGNSGSIFLQANDSVSLGRNSAIFNQVGTGGVGNAGDINITAGSLSLTDGAQIQAFVDYDRDVSDGILPSGRGDAGDVNINVRDSVTLVGRGRDSGTGITAIWNGVGFRGAEGDGGDVNINARSLSLTNAVISSDTNGNGDAGDIFIRAVDAIHLTNSDSVLEASRRSRIGSAVTNKRSVGNGGNIDIQSRSLFLDNGAVLDARTQGNGNAGNIRVSANTLTATNGGQISTTSQSSFRAGTISLDVTDSVTLSGSDPNFAQRRDDQFSLNIYIADSPASGLFTRTKGTGAAGDLQITTKQLSVRDGAQVTVSSQDSGIAGSLIVEADSIRLDNKATISADTTGGGGNINFSTGDLILRRGSSISTNATGSNITGGNITIGADNLVTPPKENSDISANATEGIGGRVIVNASGIFGTQFRPQDTPLSDITASSDLGSQFNGVVQLNTLGIEPSRGLANLPIEVVDASNQIDRTCSTRGGEAGENEFIVTGRGGLPPNPSYLLSPNAVWIDLDSTTNLAENRPRSSQTTQMPNSTPKQIVEATGWTINNKGKVVLTTSVSTTTPPSPGLTPAKCHAD